jgi:hypothetical protein
LRDAIDKELKENVTEPLKRGYFIYISSQNYSSNIADDALKFKVYIPNERYTTALS